MATSSGTARDSTDYVREQYKTTSNLAVRIRTHELYGEPKVDFAKWVLDQIAWRGDELVVDVGCGAGIYVEAAGERAGTYIAGDLSLGMLKGLSEQPLPRLNLDAQFLPLVSDAVDVVLANHMLYHVPDREQALSEFCRVLRPAGYLLAATNSATSMSELEALSRSVADTVGIEEIASLRTALTFDLETGGDLLRRHFSSVRRHDLPGALVFPEAQPVIDYVASSRERFEQALPKGTSWPDVVDVMRSHLERHIAEHGSFRVNKRTGVFVCRNS